MKHFDHKRKEFDPYGFTCERWEPVRMQRPDKHTEVELNYLEQGRLTYLFWGERVTVEAARPALFWATTPHQIIDFEDVTCYTVITLPLPWILSWNLPEKFITRIMSGYLIQDSSQLKTDKMLFDQWYKDINFDSTDFHEIVFLEIKARLLRFAANLEQNESIGNHRNRKTKPVGIHNVSKIESMARFISQNYTNQICISDIASHVNLHPDYAASIFKKTFGVTINHFLIQHRVQHAQRMLVTTNDKIIEIAFASGFNSLSRFNASFKSLCSCTPRQYRVSHQLPY